MKDRGNPKSRREKKLASTAKLNEYQKKWFQSLQQKIKDSEPYIIANADTPHEIFTQWIFRLFLYNGGQPYVQPSN